MPPNGGPRGAKFLTEEEKNNRPKVTKELLARVFSYLRHPEANSKYSETFMLKSETSRASSRIFPRSPDT